MGADQITNDVAKMVAQVPALFETLTGMKVNELINQIPALSGNKASGTNGHSTTPVITGESTQNK
jgi:flotillin